MAEDSPELIAPVSASTTPTTRRSAHDGPRSSAGVVVAWLCRLMAGMVVVLSVLFVSSGDRTSAVAVSADFPPVRTVVGVPDPLGVIRDYRLLDRVTLGTDRVAVVRCVVPTDTTDDFYRQFDGRRTRRSPRKAVAWLRQHVVPYFDEVSKGRMSMEFRSAGSVSLEPSDGPQQCAEKAERRTRSTDTNVLAFDTTLYTGGFAGMGTVQCFNESCSVVANGDGVAPSQSGRSAWVGGGAVGTVPWLGISLVVHELGHTFGWSHSYRNPDDEYENIYDIMSGDVPCEIPPPGQPCLRDAHHTLAINRYTAGWISEDEVMVLESGESTIDLAAPLEDGVQMVIVRLDASRFLTIEARPRVGRDVNLPVAGIAVHEVRVGSKCADIDCPVGTERRHLPASRDGSRAKHVVTVGSTKRFAKVDVQNVATVDSGYRVTVTVP